jgi:hypothetical protein
VFVVQTEYTLFAITSFLPSIEAAISLSSHIMSLFVRLGNWKSTKAQQSYNFLESQIRKCQIAAVSGKKEGEGRKCVVLLGTCT